MKLEKNIKLKIFHKDFQQNNIIYHKHKFVVLLTTNIGETMTENNQKGKPSMIIDAEKKDSNASSYKFLHVANHRHENLFSAPIMIGG